MKLYWRYFLFLLAIIVALAGCTSITPTSQPGPAEPVASDVPVETIPGEAATVPAATAIPSPSPTAAPQKVILVTPVGADAALAQAVDAVVNDLAQESGLVVERRQELNPEMVGPETRLVVSLAPDPGLAAASAANPLTQFLAVGVPELEPAANLSLIGPQGQRPDQAAFLAGYLAALLTQDWRVGVLAPEDTASGKAAQNGFRSGAIYFCGFCRPAYPPFVQYPVVGTLPEGAGPVEAQAAAQRLLDQSVETVYVAPGVDPAALETLAQAGVALIGSGPAPANVSHRWAASISSDLAPALREIWPQLLAGQGGLSQPLPLDLSEVNDNLVSQGRQDSVARFLEDLLSGYVDTGVDPVSGEALFPAGP